MDIDEVTGIIDRHSFWVTAYGGNDEYGVEVIYYCEGCDWSNTSSYDYIVHLKEAVEKAYVGVE